MILELIRETAVIIVAIAILQCQSFELDLSPSSIVIDTTKNVTLECHPQGGTAIAKSPLNIRILKEDQVPHWHMIAELEANKPDVTVYEPNLLSYGRIGNLNDAYLTVTWPLATGNILGRYRCDVVGYNMNQDLVQEKTHEILISEYNGTLQEMVPPVTIEDDKSTEYLINKLEDIFINETQVRRSEFLELIEKINDIEDNRRNETEIRNKELEDLTKKVGNVENILTKLTQNVNSQLPVMTKEINETENNLENLTDSVAHLSDLVGTLVKAWHPVPISEGNKFWPEGSFGLMATSSGCPANHGDPWYTGYRKHHTESTDANHNQFSLNNHLQQPLIEISNNQTFMYQRFCLMNVSSGNYFWPHGSYCINRLKFQCPGGFSVGYVHWDEEDTNHSASSGGVLPFGAYLDDDTTIHYCCRSDGPANSTVELPRDMPFYLYRFGGQCQQVAGMNVTEEFMLFDTENIRNTDSYQSTHPDGQADDDVKIELCYYFPVV